MSTLLVDVGNSRIKWARWVPGRLGKQRGAAYHGWRVADFERALFARSRPDRILVASVAGREVERRLAAAARNTACDAPEFVRSTRKLGGVRTRYAEPWRLGVDRLLAVIGAVSLSGKRPALVVDIGTAMTLDLLTAAGEHVGGAIVPGPRLMVGSLLRETSGIERRARDTGRGRTLFARNTRGAIEQGALFAAAALIDRAVAEAHKSVGPLRVFLTGGAAVSVSSLVRESHRSVPDLVLRGLAVLANESAAH